MRSFDCLIGWQAHEGEVCSIQFSADETTAYSMGTDGKVRNKHHMEVIDEIVVITRNFIKC